MKKVLIIMGIMMMVSACGRIEGKGDTAQENGGQENLGQESVVVNSTESVEGNASENSMGSGVNDGTAKDEAGMSQREVMEQYVAGQQYAGCFLYDVTGDNFPEMIEIVPMYFSMDYDVVIYDFSGEKPMPLLYAGGNEGETIYLCEDTDGERFLLYHESDYYSSGTNSESYIRADISGHSINQTVLGRAENFYQNIPGREYAYNAVLEFEGADIEGLGSVDKAVENSGFSSEEVLRNCFEEYLGTVTVIDELVLPDGDGMEAFLEERREAANQYLYTPEYAYEEWLFEQEKKVQERSVLICGKDYDTEAKSIYLYVEDLDENFDSDVLNQFPNLEKVSFLSKMVSFEDAKVNRIPIKASKWCGRIDCMEIDLGQFEMTGDFSGFANIKEVIYSGRVQGTDYLFDIRKIPQAEIVRFYMGQWDKKDFINAFVIVGELSNVKVAVYSGHMVMDESLSEEEWASVYKALAGKILTCEY